MPIDSVAADPKIQTLIERSRLSLDEVCRRAKISSKTVERIRKGDPVKPETFFRFVTALDDDPVAFMEFSDRIAFTAVPDIVPNEQLIIFKDDRNAISKKVYMDPYESLDEENIPTTCLFKIEVGNANENCVETVTSTVESLDSYYSNSPTADLDKFTANQAINNFKQKNLIDANIEYLKGFDIDVYSAQWVHWARNDIKEEELKVGENWWRTHFNAFYISDRIQSRNIAAIVNECYYPPLYDEYSEGMGTIVEGIRRLNKESDNLPF